MSEGTRRLPVKLQEHEVLSKGRTLAAVLSKIDRVTIQAKAVAEGFKTEQKNLEKDAERLGEEIETGYEQREVDVIETPNVSARTIETVRCDTYALVESRAMNEWELRKAMQPDLPFTGGRVETKKTAKDEGASDEKPNAVQAALDALDNAVGAVVDQALDAKRVKAKLTPAPLKASIAEHADADPDGPCLNAACSSKRSGGRKGRCRPCADFFRRHGTERHPSKGATVKDSTVAEAST